MPKTTFMGHPLHPQLIVAPAGLLPFSFVMDLLFRSTRKTAYRDAAYYSLVGGLVGGAAAGATGAMDYMTIPSGSHEKKTANVHAALNIALIAAAAVNVAVRMRGSDARDPLPFALSALAVGGVIVSGWYGGHLVYKHGVRVKDRSPIERENEAKLPGDEYLERGLTAIDRWAPSRGPQLNTELPRHSRGDAAEVHP
jgi:uncharacterized membrane protein